MSKIALLMNEKDNVATVLDYVYSEELVKVSINGRVFEEIKAIDEIDYYHKIAIKEIRKGDKIFKYGEVIGKATEDINIGKHVHVNNIESVMVL